MLSINFSQEFRKEIQGLRALAVTGVVIYHCGFEFFAGGFVGVDVFFTISGFLITNSILWSIKNKSFSITKFYVRRIRRLFPALVITLLSSCLVALVIYPPELVTKTFKSALAAFFSVSNFYFLGESGYWDFSAKFKPLLHTWSLGVEEQFYLIYPLILLFFYSKKLLRLVAVMVSIMCLSLLSSVLWTPSQANYAFYMLPFRMFELILGGFICFLPDSKKYIGEKLAGILVVGSLMVIVLSFIYFDEISDFPGWWPLLPCLSCCLIIYLKNASISQPLLGNRCLTYIGKISYSLYLIHWPLIVFYTFLSQVKLGVDDKLILIFISFLLAIIMYKFIEAPFRYGHPKEKLAVIFAMFVLIFLAVILFRGGQIFESKNPVKGVTGLSTKMVNLKRYEKWLKQCNTKSSISPERCLKPDLVKKNVLIVGDSHGIDGYNIMSHAFPENHYMLISEKGCTHLVHAEQSGCDRNFDYIEKYLSENTEVKYVVYSIRMDESRYKSLVKTIEKLKDHKITIIVLGIGPWYSEKNSIVAYQSDSFEEAQLKINGFLIEGLFALNQHARQVTMDAGAIYVDKLAYYCKQPSCDVFTQNKKELITYDRNHLSFAASIDFANYIADKYDYLYFFDDN